VMRGLMNLASLPVPFCQLLFIHMFVIGCLGH
jgi:hypothetical protein